MTSAISFRVHGTPAPQGSKRHVGNGVMVESSAAVKPWREAVKYAAIDAMDGQPPIRGPVALVVSFWFRKPASAPKSRQHPARRPDLDKLLRSTLDAMSDAAVWIDDAQVVEIDATKSYCEADDAQGAVVSVRAL